MALKKSITFAPFTGINTGVNPHFNQEGSLLLENGMWTRAQEITKRFGSTKLTGQYTNKFLSRYNDSPMLLGDTAHISTVNTPNASGVFVSIQGEVGPGLAGFCDAYSYPISSGKNDYNYAPDVAVLGDVIAYSRVFGGSGAANYVTKITTMSRQTNAMLASLDAYSTTVNTNNCKLLIGSSKIWAIYSCSTEIRAKSISTSGSISGSTYTLSTSMHASLKAIDACWITTSKIAIAHVNAAADIAVHIFDTDAHTYASTSIPCSAGSVVSVAQYSQGYVSVCYSDTNALEIRGGIVDTTPALTGPSNVQIRALDVNEIVHHITQLPAYGDPSTMDAFYTSTDSSLYSGTGGGTGIYRTYKGGYQVVSGTGYAVTFAILFRGTCLTAKAARDTTGRAILQMFIRGFGYGNSPERHRIVGNDLGQVIGKYQLYEAEHTVGVSNSHLSESPALGNDWWITSNEHVMGEGGQQTGIGISLAECSRKFKNRRSDYLDNLTLISNSCPYIYDGTNIAESGFLLPPGGLTTADNGVGTMPAGAYTYCCTFAWADSQGRVWRSAPSAFSSTTIAINRQIAIIAPSCTITRKENVVVEIWRTKVDGTTFYHLTDLANPSVNHQVTYSDNATDASIAVRARLDEASTSILSSYAPVPYNISCVFGNRHFIVDADNDTTRIYYSQEFVPGDFVRYSPELVISVPHDNGKITALWPDGDRLIIGKERAILATTGPGLDSAGGGGIGGGLGYMPPTIIVENAGVTSQASVLRTPIGTLFQSQQGISVISNNGLSPVGQPAYEHLQNRTITGSGYMPSHNLAVWLFASGSALTYNTLHNAWSTFSGWAGDSIIAANNNLFWHDASSYVNCTNTAIKNDNGTAYGFCIITPWYQFQTMLGVKRIYRADVLGYAQGLDSNTLTCEVSYDLLPKWITSTTYQIGNRRFDSSDHYTNAGVTGLTYERPHIVTLCSRRQKVHAIRYRITDNGTHTWSTSGIGFVIGVKPRNGLYRNATISAPGAGGSGGAGSGSAGG